MEFKAYQDRLVRLMAEPDVQLLLQAFPGAEIDKIEDPDPTV